MTPEQLKKIREDDQTDALIMWTAQFILGGKVKLLGVQAPRTTTIVMPTTGERHAIRGAPLRLT